MAYSGWLLKISEYTFPRNKIAADSYHARINSQDYEPFTDADGYLHRDSVPLKALTVDFDTVAMMTNTELSEIMRNIRSQYQIPTHSKQVTLIAYVPELDDYVTQVGYFADIDPTMYFADDNKIIYDSIHFSFVGGVAEE